LLCVTGVPFYETYSAYSVKNASTPLRHGHPSHQHLTTQTAPFLHSLISHPELPPRPTGKPMPRWSVVQTSSGRQQFWSIFAARCYASAAYAVMRCLSVCPSVCQTFSPSDSHTICFFFVQNVMTMFPWGPPNGGVECRCGKRFDEYLAIGSMTAGASAINNC